MKGFRFDNEAEFDRLIISYMLSPWRVPWLLLALLARCIFVSCLFMCDGPRHAARAWKETR
jgi:hypothetical protein